MNFLLVTDGVDDANNHVQFMIGNCPATRLVLGGYSQGAAVISVLVGATPNRAAIPGVGAIPGLGSAGTPLPPRPPTTWRRCSATRLTSSSVR